MPRPVPNCLNCAPPTGVGADGRCPRCGCAVVPGPTRPLVGSPSPRPDGPGADDWNPGAVILGLYDVQELCGEGGMGRVYRVRHRGWNADLAVKCPRPEWFATEAGKADFEREAATWVNLGLHPHVVTCHYVRRIGGVPRIFAEFVPGGSLADRLRDGRLPPDLALAVAVQAAWGLHFAHEQGLVHQDVKPANILLTAEAVAKVTDFGLARAHRSATGRQPGRPGQSRAVTAAGLCTPGYAAPEQLEGRPLTRRTDVWAWAVTLLELLTGLRPRHGPSVPELLEEVSRTGPALPPGVTTVLRACFRPEPAERPGSMAELDTSRQ